MYNTVQHFQAIKKLTLPKPHKDWRLVKDFPTGEIDGIPTLRGVAVATNGIIVLVEMPNGEVINGHMAHFKKDKKEREANGNSNNKDRTSVYDLLQAFEL